MPKVLNDKQKTFCLEYIVDFNGTAAAIKAGYSEKTANRIASENLSKLDIQKEIQRLINERSQRTEITADRVLIEYAKIAFLDIRKYYNTNGSLKNITDLDETAAGALSGVDVFEEFEFEKGSRKQIGVTKKIKTYNKVQALDSLGKHLGMFTDKLKINFAEFSDSQLDQIMKELIKPQQ